MHERRKEQRWPAYLGGVAELGLQSTADCLIRNTSSSGARLTVENADLVPEEFTLHIPTKQTEVRVATRWRRADRVGIEALPWRKREEPVDLALVRRLRQLHQRHRDLRQRLPGATEPVR